MFPLFCKSAVCTMRPSPALGLVLATKGELPVLYGPGLLDHPSSALSRIAGLPKRRSQCLAGDQLKDKEGISQNAGIMICR